MENLGVMLREVRKSHGTTMKDLAASVQIDQSLISKYENDHRYPPEEHIIAIASHFKESSDMIMTRWISEKIYSIVKKYPTFAEQAMSVAEERIAHLSKAQAMEAPILDSAIKEKIAQVNKLQASWNEQKPVLNLEHKFGII